MKALVYLLGARAINTAHARADVHPRRSEESLGPLASTEATAAAWRRWSQAGRTEAITPDAPERRPAEAHATRATSI
jgi:hypothetical protein